jgi:hypothetical protein
MKKKLILMSVLACVANLNAQTTAADSKKDNPDFKKNEISINTAPIFRQLSVNNSSDATRFSAAYKRYLNESSALRFSIVVDFINNEAFSHGFPDREVIFLNSDSTMVRQTTLSPAYISPHLNIGYERLFGRRKLKWFYGADLAMGYSESRTVRQNSMLHKDTVQGTYGWTEDSSSPEIISRLNTKTVSVGVSPFFGAKYPITQRFSVSAQVGVDATFRSQEVSGTNIGYNRAGHFSSFDFNQDTGFLNDISFIYKF